MNNNYNKYNLQKNKAPKLKTIIAIHQITFNNPQNSNNSKNKKIQFKINSKIKINNNYNKVMKIVMIMKKTLMIN